MDNLTSASVIKLIENNPESSRHEGRLISFFSFKGGVGKSVFASNLALELAQTFPKQKIALVDFNLYNPDIATMLKIDIQKGKVIKNYFCEKNKPLSHVTHSYPNIDNIDLFLSDYDLLWLEVVTEEMVTQFISELKVHYDYIVIDTHPALDFITTFIAMKLSDRLVCVTTPDIPSLRNTDQERMKYLRALGINAEICMILTRYNVTPHINISMVKQEKGVENVICIHEKPALIMDSINKGEPLVLGKTKDASVKKIRGELQKLISFIADIDINAIKQRLND